MHQKNPGLWRNYKIKLRWESTQIWMSSKTLPYLSRNPKTISLKYWAADSKWLSMLLIYPLQMTLLILRSLTIGIIINHSLLIWPHSLVKSLNCPHFRQTDPQRWTNSAVCSYWLKHRLMIPLQHRWTPCLSLPDRVSRWLSRREGCKRYVTII